MWLWILLVPAFSVSLVCETNRTTQVPPTTTVFTSTLNMDLPGQGGFRTFPVKTKRKVLGVDGKKTNILDSVSESSSSSSHSDPDATLPPEGFGLIEDEAELDISHKKNFDM
jgi:hypothetical protein